MFVAQKMHKKVEKKFGINLKLIERTQTYFSLKGQDAMDLTINKIH